MKLRDRRRPLAIFGNGLGDHLMTLPALRALAHGFDGRLALLVRPGTWRRFFRDLPLRSVFEYPFDAQDNACSSEIGEAIKSCDLLLWMNPWRGPLMRDALSRCADSVGFFDVCTVKVSTDTHHAIDQAFTIAQHVFSSARLNDFVQPPCLDSRALEVVRRVREIIGPSRRLLVVHPDPSVPKKRWAAANWHSTISTFLDRSPDTWCIVIGGSAETGWDQIGHDRLISLCGMSLSASMAMVAVADVFVGVDSCFLHVADLFRVPSVGLFGPTRLSEFGFRLTPIHEHVDGLDSMGSISVVDVLGALERIAERSKEASPRPQPRSADGQGHCFMVADGSLRRTWKVESLWRAAATEQTHPLDVSTVDLDQPVWYSSEDRVSIRSLLGHYRRIAAADLGTPVILGPDGTLMDGMHRVMRAVLESRADLPAVRLTTLPEPWMTELVRESDG